MRRHRQLVLGLAAAQVLDALGGELVPRRYVEAHLDHLGVPSELRPALGVIKVTASVGLVAGLKWPRLGAVTSAALVSYYAAAARFHLLAGDHAVIAAPAAAFGAGAAVALTEFFLPASRR
jgi:hypothetical protein